MKMEGGPSGLEARNRTKEVEEKLRKTAEMKEKVESYTVLHPEKKQELLEKIAAVEEELYAEATELYKQLQEIEPRLATDYRFEVSRAGYEKGAQEQDDAGNSLRDIWASVGRTKAKLEGALATIGLSSGFGAMGMAYATVPSATELATQAGAYTESVEWMSYSIEGLGGTLAVVAAANLAMRAVKKIRENNRFTKVLGVRADELHNRGME